MESVSEQTTPRLELTEEDAYLKLCELTGCCLRKLLSHREVGMTKEWQRVALLILHLPESLFQVKMTLHNQDYATEVLKRTDTNLEESSSSSSSTPQTHQLSKLTFLHVETV